MHCQHASRYSHSFCLDYAEYALFTLLHKYQSNITAIDFFVDDDWNRQTTTTTINLFQSGCRYSPSRCRHGVPTGGLHRHTPGPFLASLSRRRVHVGTRRGVMWPNVMQLREMCKRHSRLNSHFNSSITLVSKRPYLRFRSHNSCFKVPPRKPLFKKSDRDYFTLTTNVVSGITYYRRTVNATMVVTVSESVPANYLLPLQKFSRHLGSFLSSNCR